MAIKNTSQVTWQPNTHVLMHDNFFVTLNNGHPSGSEPVSGPVAPGETATWNLLFIAGGTQNDAHLRFHMANTTTGPFGTACANVVRIRNASPIPGADTSRCVGIVDAPLNVTQGQPAALKFSIANVGQNTWVPAAGGGNYWVSVNGQLFALPQSVPTGGTANISLNFTPSGTADITMGIFRQTGLAGGAPVGNPCVYRPAGGVAPASSTSSSLNACQSCQQQYCSSSSATSTSGSSTSGSSTSGSSTSGSSTSGSSTSGSSTSGSSTSSSSSTPFCGNGWVEGAEYCDDGNLANGDCCNSLCRIEAGCMCLAPPVSSASSTSSAPGTSSSVSSGGSSVAVSSSASSTGWCNYFRFDGNVTAGTSATGVFPSLSGVSPSGYSLTGNLTVPPISPFQAPQTGNATGTFTITKTHTNPMLSGSVTVQINDSNALTNGGNSNDTTFNISYLNGIDYFQGLNGTTARGMFITGDGQASPFILYFGDPTLGGVPCQY